MKNIPDLARIQAQVLLNTSQTLSPLSHALGPLAEEWKTSYISSIAYRP